ncbi:hypothetical protein Tco_0737975 [Tanacetum coccineum]
MFELHGTPSSIVSDRDPIVYGLVLKGLTAKLGENRLNVQSTEIYPQTDGSRREDHSDFGRYVEGLCFGMDSSWMNICAWWSCFNIIVGHASIRAALSRLLYEFQVGDRVFLKVSPFRGVKRFGIKGKLSPRFIGPFEILERIGEVSYRLALPPQLSHIHDVYLSSLFDGDTLSHPLHVASFPFDQISPVSSLSEEHDELWIGKRES